MKLYLGWCKLTATLSLVGADFPLGHLGDISINFDIVMIVLFCFMSVLVFDLT